MTAAAIVMIGARAQADDLPPPMPPAEPPAEGTPNAPPGTPPPPSPEEEVFIPPPMKLSPPKKKNIGVTGRLSAGFGQRRLFEDSVLGADLCTSVGAYTDSFNAYLDLQMFFGGTNGLPFQQYRVGPSIDFEAFTRVRIGAGLSLGGTTITRKTTDNTLQAFSAGARLYGTVDLFQFNERDALYVLGQLSVDSAGTFLGSKTRGDVDTAVLWGPTIALGVRF